MGETCECVPDGSLRLVPRTPGPFDHRWMCSGIGRCVVEGDHDECSEQSEGWSQGKRPNVRPIESEGSDRHSPSHTCRNKQVLTEATKVIGPEIQARMTHHLPEGRNIGRTRLIGFARYRVRERVNC